VLSAGGSLQWYRDEFCQAEVAEAARDGVDPYEKITAVAAQAPAGSEGLFFLPYLTGERTPHADPYARGAWIGLTRRHGRSHLVRSVIEGATYAMRDCLEIIKGMDIPVQEIRVSGGGARSPFWRQVQADIYSRKVSTINAHEGPAFGVALLAAAGTGAYRDVVEACKATIQTVDSTVPNTAAKKVYQSAYPHYGPLYAALKPEFRKIARLVGQR
jgi:xylulokinase